eukprot:3808826-Prymnesium_polylepis.1
MYTSAFESKTSLQAAVNEFCVNSAMAEANYGPISSWDVNLITDMSSLFLNCQVPADLQWWDVRNVITMSVSFALRADLSTGDVCTFSVQPTAAQNVCCIRLVRVADKAFSLARVSQSMFNGASAFNSDVSRWDVSKVTSMS